MNKLKIFGEVKNLQFGNDSFLIFFKIEDPRRGGVAHLLLNVFINLLKFDFILV